MSGAYPWGNGVWLVAVLWSGSKVGAWADAPRGERRSLKMCCQDVRKAVEASLHIKHVIYQTSRSDEHYTAKYS